MNEDPAITFFKAIGCILVIIAIAFSGLVGVGCTAILAIAATS